MLKDSKNSNPKEVSVKYSILAAMFILCIAKKKPRGQIFIIDIFVISNG